MNAVQRNRSTALLKAAGYEDAPALDPSATEGRMPAGREISLSWLAGVVMTGLTSVLLMGGALYVSFLGQDTFSTAVDALPAETSLTIGQTSLIEKTRRVKPVALTRSELETVEASIREDVEGHSIVRNQPFSRLQATLATSATSLTENIPALRPGGPAQFGVAGDAGRLRAGLDRHLRCQCRGRGRGAQRAALACRNAGQAAFRYSRHRICPPGASSTSSARAAMAPTSPTPRRHQFPRPRCGRPGQPAGRGREHDHRPQDRRLGKRRHRPGRTHCHPQAGRTAPRCPDPQRIHPGDDRRHHGDPMRNVYPSIDLPFGSRLRILFGPSRIADTVIPYRLSVYVNDSTSPPSR